MRPRAMATPAATSPRTPATSPAMPRPRAVESLLDALAVAFGSEGEAGPYADPARCACPARHEVVVRRRMRRAARPGRQASHHQWRPATAPGRPTGSRPRRRARTRRPAPIPVVPHPSPAHGPRRPATRSARRTPPRARSVPKGTPSWRQILPREATVLSDCRIRLVVLPHPPRRRLSRRTDQGVEPRVGRDGRRFPAAGRPYRDSDASPGGLRAAGCCGTGVSPGR